eukprot:2166531-Amphidinium_carterae.1
MRRLGTFSGLAQAGKLGDIDGLAWLHCTPLADINLGMSFPGNQEPARAFIEEVVPHWFDEKLRTKAVLDRFCKQLLSVQEQQDSIVKYMYADPLYVGFHHQNGNTDNAYFYKREDGTIDCGMYDWGSTAKMAYASGLLGCVLSALGEMLVEHEESLIQCWLDAYHQTGAARLDKDEFLFRYRLATALQVYGLCATTKNYLNAEAKDFLKTAPTYNCAAITQNFSLKFTVSM